MKQKNQIKDLSQYFTNVFPLKDSPLVQCITNEITCESMANALLFVHAQPVMADDIREFSEFFSQNSSLLLNLGHLSKERETSLLTAASFARKTKTPFVVDLVGVSATLLRKNLANELAKFQPNVIKGNTSEMRTFCGLESSARGVDASPEDQSEDATRTLIQAMKNKVKEYPEMILLATGENDLIVSKEKTIVLSNGVEELARFTGTGDIVGAIIAALLGSGEEAMIATIMAVSYFNLCGEEAKKRRIGLADFREETLNQLSLLMNDKNWHKNIRGKCI